MYPPRQLGRPGASVAIRGDRPQYGGMGCPTPMPYPPMPVRPIREPDNGGEIQNDTAGSFTIPNQSVPANSANAIVALGTTNFSDGVTISGNQVLASKKGIYTITLNLIVRRRDDEEVILTFNATGNIQGAPNPLATVTIDDDALHTINVPMIAKIPADNSGISFTVTSSGGVAIINGGTVSMYT